MSTTADPFADTDALIDHILERYHATHRRELPELIALARRVETVHADHASAPRGLAALLTRVEWEMESHMQKEEQGLFPMLREGHGVPMAMELMRDEHEEHAGRLVELAALTSGHTPPEGACGSWRALCAGTAKLAADLVEHIRLENELLFPRFGG
jgi:regulator of cell morphogenesis and NO signaling